MLVELTNNLKEIYTVSRVEENRYGGLTYFQFIFEDGKRSPEYRKPTYSYRVLAGEEVENASVEFTPKEIEFIQQYQRQAGAVSLKVAILNAISIAFDQDDYTQERDEKYDR